MEKRNYVAFISYRHTKLDSTVAKTLHTLIEQFRIPKGICNDNKKRLGTVFRDHEELSLSSDLSEEICNALDHSEYLIVVCSEKTRESHWVHREIDYFLSHHDQTKVFVVIVDGESKDVIPQSLIKVVNPETGTVTSSNPLAANICSNSVLGMYKKLRVEKLRLFAAMLNCSYDKLFMREQRRQRRQVISIASMILTIVLAFSAMLLVKNREISQKNLLLAQQKAEVQLRESELLVQDAEEALANGNTLSAVQKALAALPSVDNDRPYYAPAERMLISALGFFDSASNYIITNTILEQNTPILDFCISEDGTQLATVDAYGTVTCFDTNNGTVVWSAQQDNLHSNDNAQIFSVYTSDSFIVFSNTTVAYSRQTGAILWTYDGAVSAIQSEDQSKFIFLSSELNMDNSHYLYYLVCLSAENGKVLHKIPLIESTMMDPKDELPYISFPYKFNGALSVDGKIYTGCYLEEQASSKCILHYYIVDLEKETIESVYSISVAPNSSESNIYKFFLCDNDKSLVVIRGSTTDFILEKIDLQSSRLLWTLRLTESELYGATVWHCAHTSKRVFLGCKNWLYVINLSTGEQITSIKFEAEFSLLETLDQSYYRFILSDGTFGIGIGGLIYHQSAVLGDTQSAELWQNGIFELIEEEGYNKNIEASADGYMAIVPQENNHCVAIKRALYSDPATQETILDIPKDSILSGLKVWPLGTDALVVGSSSSSFDYQFNVVDSVTHQVKNTFNCPNDYIDANEILFLSDESAYIQCDNAGNITRHDTRNEGIEILSKAEHFPLFEQGEWEYCPSRFESASAMRLSDGKVVTIRCDKEQLRIWLDGTEQMPITFPEHVNWIANTGIATNHFLDVGSNGYVLISNFENNLDLQLDGLMAYDTLGRTWHPISTEFVDISSGFVCLGAQQPILAIADSTSQIFIFDIITGEIVNHFSIQIPVNSIEEMKFILEDSFIVIRNRDSQLMIYDTVSGQIVFREQLQDSYYDSMEISVDRVNQRLYIILDGYGICLDISSWTKLVDIPGMIYYDYLHNEIYRYENNNVLISNLPSTSELVQIGQNQINIK